MDRGFISPYFVIDIKSQKVECEKPFLLLSEKTISLLQDILPSLEAAVQARHPLIIFAENADGEALAACVLIKPRGPLQVAAVKAPGFGDDHKSILGDFHPHWWYRFPERATVELLGSTGSIPITKEDTIVLNGEGSERIRCIVADPTASEFDKLKLQGRLAKLSVAVVLLSSNFEAVARLRSEKKDCYDDAFNATREGSSPFPSLCWR